MASTVLSHHHPRPSAPLTPNNHQPRPSPSKRALSSPNSSPPLGGCEQQESPRVTRTRLSYSVEGEQHREAVGATMSETASSHGRETPSSPTAAAGAGGLIGLGVGLPQEKEAVELQTTEEGATQTKTAQEQQRQLYEMPVELHQALAKLSSQHHMSEYNQLKQRTALQLQLQQQQQLHPPIRAVPLQRSQSSPLIGSNSAPSQLSAAPRPPLPLPISIPAVPVPAQVQVQAPTTRPPILRAATNWPAIFRPVINLANSVTSTPDRSRSNTPPVSGAPELRGEVTASTLLTPTLANMAFDSSTPRTPEDGSPTKDIAAALNDAIKSNMDRAGDPGVVPVEREPTPPPAPAVFKAPPHAQPPPPPAPSAPNGLLPGMKSINGVAVKTSVSHPMNISALVPPEYLARFAQAIFSSSSTTSLPIPKPPLQDSTSFNSNGASPASPTPFLLSPPPLGDLYDLLSTTLSHDAHLPSSTTSTTTTPLATAEGEPTLGNFMLSSCPGKKVRMNGVQPKGGRSAICRDVGMDLGRAKEMGVGLVICCLDDSELSFLGAPWSEYSLAASSHSLALIRIPMVEGFAPSSPTSLDAQLDRVIREYTLKGRSVLAHCRGGIGRAGLVACCWLIKMAFVGEGGKQGGEQGEGRAMRVVERVIEVIRKRRSVKSIETPVQVAFLLAYVAYLQEQATILPATELI